MRLGENESVINMVQAPTLRSWKCQKEDITGSLNEGDSTHGKGDGPTHQDDREPWLLRDPKVVRWYRKTVR